MKMPSITPKFGKPDGSAPLVIASVKKRIIGMRYAFTSGLSASSKSAGSQKFESGLEQDFLTLLEFDADVLSYESQPVTLRWSADGKKFSRYTPDVLVHYQPSTKRPSTLFEVKPQKILCRDWQLFRPRFKAAVHWCRSHGYSFHIIRDIDIQTPYLTNAQFLLTFTDARLKFIDVALFENKKQRLLAILFEYKFSTPAQLARLAADTPEQSLDWIPFVWNLLAHGHIGTDLKVRLGMSTPIWSLRDG
ncbi:MULTISPECIES: TnsA endonuclease N-terminal domain-containing protein [Deefgea]|uniref:Heteromeric transposase endonuclease subunit TnsA n=1 Tax=Deefgea chitinilytica TaxID=570276 RepID=A0ABS2CFT2_9NEIS|nr:MULTISPECIES: TnsA endonuclease N-terminal domain-containing protein [Deefgea]MBM5573005.1 heteromeric transposase endonuclease subunit TnsA [Deefgea chitinilytica]MBM9890241.1 TnsA endonuclease N-terminal domain-containing protein [Deefgea sp. CFH1-16]